MTNQQGGEAQNFFVTVAATVAASGLLWFFAHLSKSGAAVLAVAGVVCFVVAAGILAHETGRSVGLSVLQAFLGISVGMVVFLVVLNLMIEW
jgi:hypothetical protein